jgi:hypothetical protein
MKTTQRILGITLAALLGAGGSFAQNPTAPATGTPAGSASTGTTKSGGVAPATGRPSDTPTGPAAGGTGSGTTMPATMPATGTPAGSVSTGTTKSGGVAPATGRPSDTPTGPAAGGTGRGTTMPPLTPPAPVTPGKASPHTPNENASDTAKAVQAVLSKFETQRDQAMSERRALLDKLQAAKTEVERQAIITQLRTETQAQKEEQSAMGKEIRDELKKLRDQRKTGGG